MPTKPELPGEETPLRGVGRLLHVDDLERIDAFRAFATADAPPTVSALDDRQARLVRMLVSSLVSRRSSDSVQALIEDVWQHDQVRVELRGMLELLPEQIEHVQTDIGLDLPIPLKIHSRYTRAEILAAFNTGDGATPPTWQTGVWWDEPSKTDMFAFTLDKTHGGFSPTTRYRDYAISRELVHWESQSNTSLTSEIGQRYICHRESGTNIVLFARRDVSERAFWCLGPATYESHESERPIAFVWRLAHRLPADLYAEFAAAVA